MRRTGRRGCSLQVVRNILVTGTVGQIGTELVPALRARYGGDRVVASDIRLPAGDPEGDPKGDPEDGHDPFEYLDCTHIRQIESVVQRYDVGTIYHLAGILSAVAE
ncbi:MAG: NAD-dependent epimerase/dehydratase family protein, partial [Deltaproteobacteria bacterium]|nr:NAD-dependent epimerase/dehydratase family protein [Deltaproteobacteria bacterium]